VKVYQWIDSSHIILWYDESMGHKSKSRPRKHFKSPNQVGSVQSEEQAFQAAATPQSRSRHNIWEITTLKASLIIVIVGFAVFFTGLQSPFMGDDRSQIIENPVVHSIGNIRLFFEGGSMYTGQGLAPLRGNYFRPLMTTAYSLIYTTFGPNTTAFHLFQLMLYIAGTVLLYMFFVYTFKPLLALILSLIFLVHPINSQVVFALPYMQDALFFFFGMLALCLLLRFRSVKSLYFVAAFLFLSLLSKEVGVFFIVMSLLYLFWFDRKRLAPLITIVALPIVAYLAMRIHAAGSIGHSIVAPIDFLSLTGRLMTAPSIILFFISKLIFPLKLASGYYWVYPHFSFMHVLLPLIIALLLLYALMYFVVTAEEKLPREYYLTYLFFAFWLVLGLLPYLQIIPLDMTASEPWFHFSMVGLLGIIGLLIIMFPPQLYTARTLTVVAVLLIVLLSLRSAIRGTEWRSLYVRASHDVVASKEDYPAYLDLAEAVGRQGNFVEARQYAQRSVELFPTTSGYGDLGLILGNLGDYAGALNADNNAWKYGSSSGNVIAGNEGELMLVYGKPATNVQFLETLLKQYPKDAALWTDLAALEQNNKDNADAKVAISTAAKYGEVSGVVYNGIINNQPFVMQLSRIGRTITIR
jgi:tetratricopeptide (TPR) repeat protein